MISVLVPIYNTAKYLSKCIDSILHQSYKNYSHYISTIHLRFHPINIRQPSFIKTAILAVTVIQ